MDESKVLGMVKLSTETYRTRGERAALRCALGDAAALCDMIARDLAANNRARNGKGHVKKLAQATAVEIEKVGNEIWRMREMIAVPPAAPQHQETTG